MTAEMSKQPPALDADIRDLDLAPVIYLLLSRKGWSPTQVHAAELEYKGLLQRWRDAPGVPLAPSRRADALWHEHILISDLYHRQCLQLFGALLHHDPFSGGFSTNVPAPRAPLLQKCRELFSGLFRDSTHQA